MPQLKRSFVLLVNPHAGKGLAKKYAMIAAAELQRLGFPAQIRESQNPDQLQQQATELVKAPAETIIVVGGDGTLSKVLNQLAYSNKPFGLIPAGTGNDFARSLKIPFGNNKAVKEAVNIIAKGKTQEVDLGEVETPEKTAKFLTVVALGFDSKVSETTNKLKWPKGPLRYYLALLIELIRLQTFNFKIQQNSTEQISTKGILVAVGNTQSYGGGMPMCPRADHQDGQLDLTLVKRISRLKLVRLFPLLLKGTHLKRKETNFRRSTEFTVEAPGVYVYADGEKVGTDKASIQSLPKAIQIYAP